jgi:YHS domain-containing protein
MSRFTLRYGLAASIVWLPFILGGAGCGGSATTGSPVAAPAPASAKNQPPGSGVEADADLRRELAKLPPEDRALAEKQKVCPVTGEPLGSMGVPYKITLKGRTLFLCCGGCEEDFKKNADKYLVKLDRSMQEAGDKK